LILEDQNIDAELMEQKLSEEGILFSSKRVETKEDFLRELRIFAPDIIFSNYKLPVFDSSSALSIAKEHCPEVLFIFVSGTIKEELAIEDKGF
jgi:two-component SAPR family response regulator